MSGASLGEVTFDAASRRWHVRCEPHVAMRLKRVFGKLRTHARDVYALSDTAENARDLQWFLTRYPLAVTDGDRLSARADAHREQQALVDDMLAGRRAMATYDTAIPLRGYQREAVGLLLASGSLLLADDMGLGKTSVGIGAMLDARSRPAIVVTLTALPEQWRREIGRFAPQLSTHVVQRGTPYPLHTCGGGKHKFVEDPTAAGGARCVRCGTWRADAQRGAGWLPDVLVAGYSKLGRWGETLSRVGMGLVVFDECQELRHSGTQRYAGAEAIAQSARYRLGLSGTPIYNYGGEIWSVLNVIAPDRLGTYDEFSTEWLTNYGRSLKDPKAFGLHARQEGLILRRTRSDVGRELPPIQRIVQPVDADMRALDRVSESCAALARFILGLGASPRGSAEQAKKGDMLLASEELSAKLRQATGVAKAPFVADFVRILVQSGEKVLLYGWHRQVYDIWLDRLGDLHPVMYTGSESAAQKLASKDRFVSGDASVLIMSLRAGAGLDGLQAACRTVVHGELDWSRGVHEQCDCRVDRDGQKDPVMSFYMVADRGSDPIVSDVLGIKEMQLRGLLDPKADIVEKLQHDGENARRLARAYLDQVA